MTDNFDIVSLIRNTPFSWGIEALKDVKFQFRHCKNNVTFSWALEVTEPFKRSPIFSDFAVG